MSSRRIKVLRIAPEALVSLLSLDGSLRYAVEGMPKDARITWVAPDQSGPSLLSAVQLWVESDEFPELEPGDALPPLDLKIVRVPEPPAAPAPARRGYEFL